MRVKITSNPVHLIVVYRSHDKEVRSAIESFSKEHLLSVTSQQCNHELTKAFICYQESESLDSVTEKIINTLNQNGIDDIEASLEAR